MTKLQFRVLYRQFLFRMVDLELLSASAQGDVSKLLGHTTTTITEQAYAELLDDTTRRELLHALQQHTHAT